MTTPDPRWIMHLDMDSFYAALEQRDNPALRGLPVVVGALPGECGVVATYSYGARRFGIRSAMPINEAYRRCPDAVHLRPRMALYQEVAGQVRAVLETHAPVVEPISIDEAFLDISGLGATDRPALRRVLVSCRLSYHNPAGHNPAGCGRWIASLLDW